MAQPNVAREPSMDEILASIRRIIESNDPPAHEAGAVRPDDGDFEVTFERVEVAEADEPAPAPHAADMPLPAASVETALPLGPLHVPPAPALSLADVAARVRAASERNGGGRDAERPAPERSEPAATRGGPIEAEARRAPSPLFDLPRRPAAEPQVSFRQDDRPAAETASAEDIAAAAPAELESESADARALISASVGEKVASSFGALAQVLEDGPRRSFDEIAEDMLRPMLREWLDDNLPTLVERLVREEIERVARGPRR
ncbi:DUF2497 domain-containing protein [Rhizobium sp. TRM95111]|uniref:DUF2497 domain-containing protein n=1 Tax=Rhizobium alarense TaxID=2846851 RepID=UPI001F2761EB|nr:DUF2497 domain-containing protein [Rhizobium alarense]MCF3642430.1 DUF2497 domain-containing protein [Rhizobium alarense]